MTPSPTAAEQAACIRIGNAAPLGSTILDAAVVRELRAAVAREREAHKPIDDALKDLIYWAKRFETEPQGVGLDAVERALAISREKAEGAIRARGVEPAPAAPTLPLASVSAEEAWRSVESYLSPPLAEPARRPLPPGAHWTTINDGARSFLSFNGEDIGYANKDGSRCIYGSPEHQDATPRPGETPLTAAQREVEEECWKRALFGEVGS